MCAQFCAATASSDGFVLLVVYLASIKDDVATRLYLSVTPADITAHDQCLNSDLLCQQVTHTFPAVLEKLELHAFDMCKMIDPFVRYEPSTPRDLKRHLHSIEEKIVECLAWERGSSLYPLLMAACENQENQDKEAEPIKGESALSLLLPHCWLAHHDEQLVWYRQTRAAFLLANSTLCLGSCIYFKSRCALFCMTCTVDVCQAKSLFLCAEHHTKKNMH